MAVSADNSIGAKVIEKAYRLKAFIDLSPIPSPKERGNTHVDY
jgi:hypothetical protein